jgi:hypothetical protein
MTAQEKTARNFYEWAVEQDYLDTEYAEETINQMVEDFKLIHEKAPRLYYLLMEISDR